MQIFVSPTGASTGNGQSSTNPVTISRAMEILMSGASLHFLPGLYTLEDSIDLTPYSDLLVYGDGKVILEDPKGILEDVFIVGSNTQVAGIRFLNCQRAVRVVDGSSDVSIVNCFDVEYGFTFDVPAFDVGNCTQVFLRNLSSYRSKFGIRAYSETIIRGCYCKGSLGFTGKLTAYFGDVLNWYQTNSNVNGRFHTTDSDPMYGETTLIMVGANLDSGDQTATFRRSTLSSRDYTGGDRLFLAMWADDLSGIDAAAGDMRFRIADSGGAYMEFAFDSSGLSAGLNLVEIDLGSPDSFSGSLDREDITEESLSVDLAGFGVVQLRLDHAYILSGDLISNYNAASKTHGYDIASEFRGAQGVVVDTSPPPFLNPSELRFEYTKDEATFVTYTTLGELGMTIGASWKASHTFCGDTPYFLGFGTHRILGHWVNDETFFNTTTGLPGPDGFGLSLPFDESTLTVSGLNADSSYIGTVSESGRVRDIDDFQSHELDVVSGASSEAGLIFTPTAAVDGSAEGEIGWSGEIFLPDGAAAQIASAGIGIRLVSPSGTAVGLKAKDDCFDGWNEVTVLYSDPDEGIGSFDASNIIRIDLFIRKGSGLELEELLFDHIARIKIEGPSTAPASVGATGGVGIDLDNYTEGDVARVLSSPMLVRNAGPFLSAYWASLDYGDHGSLANVPYAVQDLGTRTIEYRFSELKPSLYGDVEGALAAEWSTLTRTSVKKLLGTKAWVMFRITFRNRVPVSS